MSYELSGWPKEKMTVGDWTPERKIVVPWATRLTEADNIDQLEYPYAPGCGAFPYEIAIEPFGEQIGASNPLATYQDALLTIRYTTQHSVDGVIIEWIDSSEFNEPFAAINRYFSETEQIDARQKPGAVRSGCVFHHIRKKVAMINPTVLSAAGLVNASTVYSTVLDISFSAETLRVRVPQIKRAWTVSGLTNYFVHQQFVFKSNGGLGWNAGFDASTGTYRYYRDDQGNRVYDYATTAISLV